RRATMSRVGTSWSSQNRPGPPPPIRRGHNSIRATRERASRERPGHNHANTARQTPAQSAPFTRRHGLSPPLDETAAMHPSKGCALTGVRVRIPERRPNTLREEAHMDRGIAERISSDLADGKRVMIVGETLREEIGRAHV